MNEHSLKKAVHVIVILFLFFSFSALASSQAKQPNDDKDKKLREEILKVYSTGGKPALIDFFQKNRDKITNKFIINFATLGMEERREEWLNISIILADENKDPQILADALYRKGEYFEFILEYEKAINYYDRTFTIYVTLNDFRGQGNVYLGKGSIYIYSGDYKRAQEMLDKGLICFKKAQDLLGQGSIYRLKGEIFYYSGNMKKTLEMNEKALLFYKKDGNMGAMGDVYVKEGVIYQFLGNYVKAEEFYNKALCNFEKKGNLMGQANVYRCKGNMYTDLADYPKALSFYEKALPLFERVMNPRGSGYVYLGKGIVYSRTGDFSPALKMYDSAFIFFEKAGDFLGQGNVWIFRGEVYEIRGDYQTALAMYDRAFLKFKKIESPEGIGHASQKKGNVYLYLSKYKQATEMYDKALKFYEETGDLKGMGNVFMRKGEIFSYTGNYKNALEMYEKANSLYIKIKDPIGLGNVLSFKGTIYFNIGDNQKAEELYKRALSHFEDIKHPIGRGYTLKRMGDIYYDKRDNLKALEFYIKAKTIFDKIGDQLSQGNVCRAMSDIYFYTGDNVRAEKMSNQAMSFYNQINDLHGQGNVYLSRGDAILNNGDYGIAIEMYEKALGLYEKVGDSKTAAFALLGKAKVFRHQKKNDRALRLYEQGIGNFEKIRFQTYISYMKQYFMKETYDHYQEAVLFMLENSYYRKGFKYADSMKARVFLDRMGEELVPLEKGLKPELRERRDDLVARLSAIGKRIYEFPGKDENKLEELKERYREVEGEFEELLIKIRLENPLYAEVRYPQPVSVGELQGEVLREGEILVRYFVAPEKVYVFLVSRDDFEVVPLDVGGEGLREVVEKYLAILKGNDHREMRRYGERFYRKLFRPLEEKLKGKGEIVVVPDGPLAMIPFESLVVGRNEAGRPVYLMETYRIKYVQSASILSILRKHYQRYGEIRGFIGFGDPVYDYENYKKGLPEKGSDIVSPKRGDEIWDALHSRYVREGGIMSRLEKSGQEVAAIAQLFRDRELMGVVKLRGGADEKEAKSGQMKDFDFIHFACHGILEDEFQCLALSQLPKEQSPEDGYFTLNEIMNCEYNARLVVLSACQSGKGKMERAEGVIGLTRAMMYAGTPAVVASLWDVDDQATRQLMVRFYKYMLEDNLDKVEALRKAKLDLINSQKYFLPVYWSGFVMYGE